MSLIKSGPVAKGIGAYLAKKRMATGLTQKEVARLSGGITSQFISNIERGTCSIPAYLLREWIEIYQIDINDFITVLAGLMFEEVANSAKPAQQDASSQKE